MRLKPRFWFLLSLLFFTAGLCLWQAGDRLAASRHASTSSASGPSVPSVPPVPSAPATAPAPAAPAPRPQSYRLSNTAQSQAELERNPRALLLRNALIDTTRPLSLAIPEALRSRGAPGSYLVQSDRTLNAEFYAALKRDGAEFVSYIPNNAALVRATPEAARVMVADAVFQAVLPYEPYFKLDGSLLPGAVNGELLTNNQLRVTVLPGQAEAAAQALAALGASVMGREPAPFGSTTLLVIAPPDQLAAVARLPQAQEIESSSPRRMLVDLDRPILGIASSPVALTNYLKLTGTNMVVVLDDTGVDTTHPDFGLAGRVTNDPPLALTDPDPEGHGTFMAGIIAGGGNESITVKTNIPGSGIPTTNQFRGMAPQAGLYVQGVDPLSGPFKSDLYLQSNASYVLTGMASNNPAMPTNGFINNLSFGYQSTAYDLSAASYDLAARNAQPGVPGEHSLLFVFAAGNGSQAVGSITSPGTAKNGITVGATDSPRFITNTVDFTNQGVLGDPIFESTTFDSNEVAAFSSGGNVDVGIEGTNGRFKPDVVAPGVFTVSTRSSTCQDPTAQQVLNYISVAGQTVLPGYTNIYPVTIFGGTTNLVIQVLPNAFSPVPFPTNLQILFDANDPPQTPAITTNAAGLPMWTNPPAGSDYISIASPSNQPWPLAFDLRAFGTQTNEYGTYYTVLSNLNSALSPWYRYESGTSMSAAAVSGMLALMQEYLTSQMPLTPSPALLKGLLINGARPLNRQSDLNMAPAVNLEGWGLPNLTNCIPTNLNNPALSSMVFFDQSPTNALQTGEWHQYQVNLSGDATNYPLRITLVWTDPPGNPAAGIALVNNLDLMVTEGDPTTTTNVYVGNDFLQGDVYTEVIPPSTSNVMNQASLSTDTNVNAAFDMVNNVQNVFLDASFGLTTTYTVWVRGTHVQVNAVTTQTNIIGQDYALIISSDDQALPLTVTDLGTNYLPPGALVTPAGNGVALLHQRVGANLPYLDEYPGSLYPAPGNTNGNPVQWHFFVFTNVNYQATNTTLYTNSGTNLAYMYTNAIFATFLPPTLTLPISSPVNESYPAANNADLDLYVSTNSALTNLDAAAVAGASKALGQGGSETVFFTNTLSIPVFYIGVKSETQQGGDFAFFATLATNFDYGNGNNPFTVSAYGLPVVIPDDFAQGGVGGANVLAFVPSEVLVRKVAVTVGVQHSNPADLYGTFTHNGQQAVLNHYTGAPGGYTNLYDDQPDGSLTNADGSLATVIPSDGPGTLQNFVGQLGSGQWILNETDNAFTQTGMVTTLTLEIWPQPLNPLDFVISNLPPNGSYFGYVDVPNDATNLNIEVRFSSPSDIVGLFITNQEVVNTSDYGTNNIRYPGGFLNLSANAASNLLFDPAVTNAPPLSGGRWFYDITNESGTTMTNIHVFIKISESLTPNLTLTEYSQDTPMPLGTDDHTLSQICINGGVLASNQQLVSLLVGVRLTDPDADNLVLHLTSPQGASVELYENRGGPSVTNLGLTESNGNYVYLTFTDNTNLAPQLIKFYPPPYGEFTTNVTNFDSSFETVPQGDYGLTNSHLFAPFWGDTLEGWTVVTNDVAVVTGVGTNYGAYEGTNYLALSSGLMTATIPTIIGQPYALTYAYRGPGLVDWWPFEGDATDIIGTNDGTITGTLTNVTGEVGLGFQFNGVNSQINFGANAGNFGTNDFTIDFWMNSTSTAHLEAFLEKRLTCDGASTFWGIRSGGGYPPGTLGLEISDAASGAYLSFVATRAVNDGLWHHIAFVRKGMDHYAYIDGSLGTQTNQGIVFNISNDFPLIMGASVCQPFNDGTQPYSGAADELDLWNRALTDVEIAAIYQAGTNHIGKATPVSIYPNCEILLNGVTNTVIAPASGTNWLTNTLYFTGLDSNTTITLKGNPLGLLFDDFVLQTPANFNYVQPEEPLAPFNGQNPYGCWTLDVWDTRTDSPFTTNGTLLSWNLEMTVSSTNVSLIVLTNHVPYIAGTVAPNNITYFAFDVPPDAFYATNSLTNCSTNLSLLFNQTALPTGNQLGDYTLLTNVPGGAYVLTNNAPPPALLPGARYFLGVQNTTTNNASFTIRVDTQNSTVTNVIALTDTNIYTTNITTAPQYYSFVVPTNAVLASFEIINPTNELDLYVRHAMPPSDTTFDYETSYNGTNDESIVILTNSTPVPLTPGTWYLAVYNANTNSTNTYHVVATYILSGGINITPLTDGLPMSGTSAPGPALTNFYSFTVINPAATAVQFVVSNILTGNVDLIAREWALPTPQQMTDGSFNPGTNAQQITIVTNAILPSLLGTTWYLGVPNNETNPVTFQITATTLTSSAPGYTTPAIVFSGMRVTANGLFTLNWTAVPGTQYQVDTTSNLTNWTRATNITTASTIGTYTDPAPVASQAARFYRVLTVPTLAVTGMSMGSNGLFTLTWSAVSGAQYEVDTSSNLSQWTKAANITATNAIGAYTDPTPIQQQSARFYRVGAP